MGIHRNEGLASLAGVTPPGPSGPGGPWSVSRRFIPFLLLLALFLGACSSAPYRHEAFDPASFDERATHLSAGGFAVSAFVPGASEAEAVLGVDVYGRDIQPVWLKVHNDSDTLAHVALTSVDPKYFPPAEVAWFFKKQFSKEGWMDLETRLIDLAMPRRIGPGETASGFVFTNVSPGTKAFNLDVFRGTMPPEYEQFTFFLRVPGFVPDYTHVRLQELYPEHALQPVTTEALPARLAGLECCTTNGDGTAQGRPVNIFFIAEPLDLLRSLLRSGWAETTFGEGEVDPQTVHHFFGRPADGVFRKPREGKSDRSELAVWKTPVLVDGQALWAAQLRHSVGRRFPLGERLFGVRLDPDVDEGRNYVLQSFWYGQSLYQWGLSPSGNVVPEATPELDFTDNPWFVLDGSEVVIWLSDEPVPMNDAKYVDWDREPAPGEDGS